MIRWATVLCCAILAGPVAAIEMSMPAGSRLVSERDSVFDSYDLPVGAWDLGTVPSLSFEGKIARQSWRVDSTAITTLQLLDPLRAQLSDAGFDIVFACADGACGGFDFRFAIEVIPAPDMYVDIRDFRFIAAHKGQAAISLLVSRSRTAGYVQIIQVTPKDGGSVKLEPAIQGEPDGTPGLAARLVTLGHVPLSDLDFGTGTARLNSETSGSLAELAAFLDDNPRAVVALVGHTDAVGELETNIALSKRRAEAVRDRLVERYGIDGDRLQAEGMGYLAPRASNLTQEGRDQNRRVEAILLSMD